MRNRENTGCSSIRREFPVIAHQSTPALVIDSGISRHQLLMELATSRFFGTHYLSMPEIR